MLTDIVKIGNSKGIRIPATLLKQYGIDSIDSKVELEMQPDCIILRPIKVPRQSWAAKFKTMHQNQDDELIWEDILDTD